MKNLKSRHTKHRISKANIQSFEKIKTLKIYHHQIPIGIWKFREFPKCWESGKFPKYLRIWKISKIPENLGNFQNTWESGKFLFSSKVYNCSRVMQVCLVRLLTLNALQCTGNDSLQCTGNGVLKFTVNDALQCTGNDALQWTGNDALQCTENVGSEICKVIYCL